MHTPAIPIGVPRVKWEGSMRKSGLHRVSGGFVFVVSTLLHMSLCGCFWLMESKIVTSAQEADAEHNIKFLTSDLSGTVEPDARFYRVCVILGQPCMSIVGNSVVGDFVRNHLTTTEAQYLELAFGVFNSMIWGGGVLLVFIAVPRLRRLFHDRRHSAESPARGCSPPDTNGGKPAK